MSTHAPDLADRYGAPSRARRPLLVGTIVVLAAVTVAWLVWATAYQSSPQVTSEMVGFDIRGQHAADATFTVVRQRSDVRASCLLRASASDHSVVGELTVPVTSGPATARVHATLRTEREATSVDLLGCSTAKQPGRR